MDKKEQYAFNVDEVLEFASNCKSINMDWIKKAHNELYTYNFKVEECVLLGIQAGHNKLYAKFQCNMFDELERVWINDANFWMTLNVQGEVSFDYC